MKKLTIMILLLMLLIILFSYIGCSNNHSGMTTSNSASSLITKIYPSNGATDVSISSSINVVFNGQMDTMSVMNNFHITYGDKMHEWIDSVTQFGGMGNMNMGQMNQMMDWMDSIHVSGEFHWNNKMDSCEFIIPDEMIPGTDYMILMNDNNMMFHNGNTMNMHMNHGDDGFHQYYFTTGQ